MRIKMIEEITSEEIRARLVEMDDENKDDRGDHFRRNKSKNC